MKSFAPSGITDYEIPDGVTTIGVGAFQDYTEIKNVIIPDSVHSIRQNAFYGCSSLQTIRLPRSIKSIGYYAFDNSVKEVYSKPITPPDGGYSMFGYSLSNKKIYVPTGTRGEYTTKQYWNEYASIIVEYDF